MKIVALGTSCVDVYPQRDKVTPGGEALNAAVHIPLLDGVQVYLMGLISGVEGLLTTASESELSRLVDLRKAAARAAEVTAYVGGIPPVGDLEQGNAVFLIRHGESMGNLTGDYSTSQHDNLSPRGREQAQILAEKLSDYSGKQEIGTIVCSPLGRAKQTIAPYLKKSGLGAQIWADLAECCWQDETDAPLSEPEQPFHSLPLEPGEETLFMGICGGMIKAPSEKESYRDGLRRMDRTAGEILSLLESGGGPVFVVCHAFCIGKLIHFLTGEGDPMAAPDLVNTSVTKLILPQGNSHLRLEYFDRPACFQ